MESWDSDSDSELLSWVSSVKRREPGDVSSAEIFSPRVLKL